MSHASVWHHVSWLACVLSIGCAEASAQSAGAPAGSAPPASAPPAAAPPATTPPPPPPPPPQDIPPEQLGTTQSFVACPVYRDTDLGRKSGCWLADDPASRARYDVTWAPIKPQVGKPLLVEGVVTNEGDTCGGIVLKPVRVSVLPGSCARTIVAPGAFPGRPSPPPVDVLKPASEPRTLPPPPYDKREFQIYFEFGRDFLIYQHAEVVLEKVQLYVQASQARSVLVQGFAASDAVVRSGRVLSEPMSIAQARAAIVAVALQRLGVPDGVVTTEAHGSPATTDLEAGKLPESSKRRVTITVTP